MIIQGKVWGETSPIFNKNNVEIHVVTIKKGGFCSKHTHKFKFNKFVVLSGKLRITIWKDYGLNTLEDVSILQANQECTVPPGYYHKFEALEYTHALELYWVELSEDDIVRSDHGGIIHASQAIEQAKNNTDDASVIQSADQYKQRNQYCNCGQQTCPACRRERAENVFRSGRPAVGFYEDH